jgi:hypothetical protein
MADDRFPDILDDTKQQFVNIYVPNTKSSPPSYNYFRLGATDADIEKGLPSDPDKPSGQSAAAAGDKLPDPGIALYTTGSYTLTAPSMNSWTADSLNAVTDGSTLFTASYTTGTSYGLRPATVTFQNVDQFTNTAAASTNFLNGDALTFWNGNDQSIGLGGLLWSNYGFTTNLFGAWILNLTNSSAEVQGFGSIKLEETSSVAASKAIDFAVTPLPPNGALGYGYRTLQVAAALSAVLTLATSGMTAAMTIELERADRDAASLKAAMQKLYFEQIGSLGVVAIVQALSILVAIMLKVQQGQKQAAVASFNMNNNGINLRFGATTLSLTNAGIELSQGNRMVKIAGARVSVFDTTNIPHLELQGW